MRQKKTLKIIINYLRSEMGFIILHMLILTILNTEQKFTRQLRYL